MSQAYKQVLFQYMVELSPGEMRSGFSAERKDDEGKTHPSGWVLTLLDNGMFRIDSGTSGPHRYVVDVPKEAIKHAKPFSESERPVAAVRAVGSK